MPIRCRPALLPALFLFWGATLPLLQAQSPAFKRCPGYAEAVAGSPSTVAVFRGSQCLELELPIPTGTNLAGLNLYRDVEVSITLSKPGTSAGAVTGFGFWDGNRTFRVRTALPAPEGTLTSQAWNWTTACRRPSTGAACAANLGLAASGSLTISSYPTGNGAFDLYKKGFVRTVGTGANRKPYLTYADGTTPFFWLGDTAWEGPVKEIQTSGAVQWLSFLDNRRRKGFTVVLVAPAPTYGSDPVRGFTVSGICADPVPNACSTPDFGYWRRFESLVEEANRQGLLVAVLGLIDPVDRGGLDKVFPDKMNPYARPSEAVRFAGYLAARLSGNHVVFSPGYDDKPTDLTFEGTQISALMNAVGAEIKRVAPRHLIGNHLAGGAQANSQPASAAPNGNYQVFESSTWLSFHLFHSGHAIKVSNGCPDTGTLTRQQCSVRRARELPTAFRGRNLPNANGEGGYDFPRTLNSPPPDNRYGARHTGYASTLSGSFGFTFGADGVYNWNSPGGVLDTPGALDMVILGNRFRALPWQSLVSKSGLIKNNPLSNVYTTEESRMFLAGTADNKMMLAYLPNNSAIEIDTTLTPKLRCERLSNSSTWSIQWYSASNGQLPPQDGRGTGDNAKCSPGVQSVILKSPKCNSPSTAGTQGGCDWVIELRDTKSDLSANAPLTPASRVLEVTARPGDEETPHTVVASLWDAAGNLLASEIPVSVQASAFQKLPVSGQDSAGNLWAVWEAEGLDGDGQGIFARRYDPQGNPLGEAFQVNTYSDGDQTDPVITADAGGHVVLAWTSLGQDGDLGGIFARRFDIQGNSLGGEIQVNASTMGHQAFPQLMADTLGNFVVAWDGEGTDGDGKGVYYRRFDVSGMPQAPEMRVNTTWVGDQAFSSLWVAGTGEITIEWAGYDGLGDLSGIYTQRYQRDGTPINGETLTVVPPPDDV